MEYIHKMAVLYEPLKTLGLLSWSLAGFTVVDDIRVEMGGCGLGGMIGGAGGGVREWNADKRERWGQAARNSSPVGRSSSRVNKVSSLQARVSADRCWGTV